MLLTLLTITTNSIMGVNLYAAEPAQESAYARSMDSIARIVSRQPIEKQRGILLAQPAAHLENLTERVVALLPEDKKPEFQTMAEEVLREKGVFAAAGNVRFEFHIPGYEPLLVEVLKVHSKNAGQFLHSLFEHEEEVKHAIPIDLSYLIKVRPEAHKKIVESVVIPLLNGRDSEIDLETISGEEAAVLLEYLNYLGVDFDKNFGPIKFIEALGFRGVEVSDPAWTLEFLKYSSPQKFVSLSKSASRSFLKDLTTSPEFEMIEGGYLHLSLNDRVFHKQADALRRLNERFDLCSLVEVLIDRNTALVLSDMVNLERLYVRVGDWGMYDSRDILMPALKALAKSQLDNQTSLPDRTLVGPYLRSFKIGGAVNDVLVQQLSATIVEFSQLTQLAVEEGDYGDVGVQALAAVLSDLKHLTHLTMKGKGVYTVEGVKVLAAALQELTQLRQLALWGTGGYIRRVGAQALAEALRHLTNLEDLKIRGLYSAEGGVVVHLAQALPVLTQLKYLDMDEVDDAGAQALARVLPALRALTQLTLKGYTEDVGTAALAGGLQELTQLTSLTLDCVKAHAALTSALQMLTQLRKLDLNCGIGTLKSLTQLTDLRLSWLKDAEVQHLAQELPMLTQLKHLDLGRLSGVGATYLAQVLPALTQLTTLGLDCSDIGALAQALPALTQLEGLGIHTVRDEGVQALGRALPALVRLKRLSVVGRYTDPGAQALGQALPALIHLKTLLIEGEYEDVGAQDLMRSLEALTHLETLWIEGRFGNAGAQALLEVLPTLRHLRSFHCKGWEQSLEVRSAIFKIQRELGDVEF